MYIISHMWNICYKNYNYYEDSHCKCNLFASLEGHSLRPDMCQNMCNHYQMLFQTRSLPGISCCWSL